MHKNDKKENINIQENYLTNIVMEKILFVTTSAPGILKDANSIMLQRILQYFPSGSYYFLSVTHIVEYIITNTPNFTFLNPYLIRPDSKIARFPLFKYTVVNLINNIYGIYQILKKGINIVVKENITKIVSISDNGLCIIGGYLLAQLKHIGYFVYLFDIWSDGYLKPIDKIIAKLLERHIFKRATNIFTVGDGISQYIDKRYNIKGITVNNVYDSNNVPALRKGIRHDDNSLFRIIYCGSVYWPQVDSIISLIHAINVIENIVLDMYVNQTIDNLYKIDDSFKNSKVCIKSYISSEKLYTIIPSYDLAFLPLYNYKGKGRTVINTAQPGKLADYLISGIPILIHAPKDSFISRYGKEYNFAYIINDKNQESFVKIIKYIRRYPEESKIKIKNALKIATKFHDPQKNAYTLLNILFNC